MHVNIWKKGLLLKNTWKVRADNEIVIYATSDPKDRTPRKTIAYIVDIGEGRFAAGCFRQHSGPLDSVKAAEKWVLEHMVDKVVTLITLLSYSKQEDSGLRD